MFAARSELEDISVLHPKMQDEDLKSKGDMDMKCCMVPRRHGVLHGSVGRDESKMILSPDWQQIMGTGAG